MRFRCGEAGSRNSVEPIEPHWSSSYHQMKRERNKEKSKLVVLFGVKPVLPEV